MRDEIPQWQKFRPLRGDRSRCGGIRATAGALRCRGRQCIIYLGSAGFDRHDFLPVFGVVLRQNCSWIKAPPRTSPPLPPQLLGGSLEGDLCIWNFSIEFDTESLGNQRTLFQILDEIFSSFIQLAVRKIFRDKQDIGLNCHLVSSSGDGVRNGSAVSRGK